MSKRTTLFRGNRGDTATRNRLVPSPLPQVLQSAPRREHLDTAVARHPFPYAWTNPRSRSQALRSEATTPGSSRIVHRRSMPGTARPQTANKKDPPSTQELQRHGPQTSWRRLEFVRRRSRFQDEIRSILDRVADYSRTEQTAPKRTHAEADRQARHAVRIHGHYAWKRRMPADRASPTTETLAYISPWRPLRLRTLTLGPHLFKPPTPRCLACGAPENVTRLRSPL